MMTVGQLHKKLNDLWASGKVTMDTEVMMDWEPYAKLDDHGISLMKNTLANPINHTYITRIGDKKFLILSEEASE